MLLCLSCFVAWRKDKCYYVCLALLLGPWLVVLEVSHLGVLSFLCPVSFLFFRLLFLFLFALSFLRFVSSRLVLCRLVVFSIVLPFDFVLLSCLVLTCLVLCSRRRASSAVLSGSRQAGRLFQETKVVGYS